MNIKIYLIIFIFLYLLTNIYYFNIENFKINRNCKKLKIIKYNFSDYPKIVIIGGVHGNEPGPVYGIENFIKKDIKKINKGNLVFIPRVNSDGIKNNTRFYKCISENCDLNRNFKQQPSIKVNKEIINNIKNVDFVIDFHEGYDFHRINKYSVGSTIKHIHNDKSKEIGRYLVDNINKSIHIKHKKFKLLKESDRHIKNTLSDYCNNNNINYNLIEITGIKNKQPLNIRIQQTYIILNNLFKYFNLYK